MINQNCIVLNNNHHHLFLFRLKYFDENLYEFEGFTTSMEAKIQDIESYCKANSSKIN